MSFFFPKFTGFNFFFFFIRVWLLFVAGKYRRREGKRMIEDQMVGRHH